MPKTIDELVAQVQELEGQIGELTKDNDDLAKQLSAAQTEAAAANRAELDTLREQLTAAQDELTKLQTETAPSPTELEKQKAFKQLPPLVQQEMMELRKRDSERAEQLAKIVEERETERSILYVEKTFPGLNLKAEVFGPVYRAIQSALQPEQLDALNTILKSYCRMAELVQEQQGRTGDRFAGADAYGLIEARAAEIRKTQPSLTKEQAVNEALRRDPDLYQRYLSEAN